MNMEIYKRVRLVRVANVSGSKDEMRLSFNHLNALHRRGLNAAYRVERLVSGTKRPGGISVKKLKLMTLQMSNSVPGLYARTAH